MAQHATRKVTSPIKYIGGKYDRGQVLTFVESIYLYESVEFWACDLTILDLQRIIAEAVDAYGIEVYVDFEDMNTGDVDIDTVRLSVEAF